MNEEEVAEALSQAIAVSLGNRDVVEEQK